MVIRKVTTRSNAVRAGAWAASAALVATVVLAPSSAHAETPETPAPEPTATSTTPDPAPEPAAPEPASPVVEPTQDAPATPEPAPAPEPTQESEPTDDAPADDSAPTPEPEEPTTPEPPTVSVTSAATAGSGVSTEPPLGAASGAAIAAAVSPSDLSVTITPSTVEPGDAFTVEIGGCPNMFDNGRVLQLAILNPVTDPSNVNIPNGDDRLGAQVSTGVSDVTALDDPWVINSTVAPDTDPGVYRIGLICQTRESLDDPLEFVFSAASTLTVIDDTPPTPTVTIDPSEGDAGDQFTATIADCPDGNGPGGMSITQGSGNHSGPTPFTTAFDYVSATQTGEPKTYVWEVTEDAAPGEYSLVFSCYTESGEPAVPLNPVSYTVLGDPFEFSGAAAIDSPSGYAGDPFTITGTGCVDGVLSYEFAGLPDDLALDDVEVIDENLTSGDDPMSFTMQFGAGAAPGDYTFELTCTVDDVDYAYPAPVTFTLLESDDPGTDPGDPGTDPDDSGSDADPASADSDDTDAGAALPAAGADVSATWIFSALFSVLVGLVLVATSRRRA